MFYPYTSPSNIQKCIIIHLICATSNCSMLVMVSQWKRVDNATDRGIEVTISSVTFMLIFTLIYFILNCLSITLPLTLMIGEKRPLENPSQQTHKNPNLAQKIAWRCEWT